MRAKTIIGKWRLYDKAMTPPAIEEVPTDEIVKCTFTVIVATANYARHLCWGLTATVHALLRSYAQSLLCK